MKKLRKFFLTLYLIPLLGFAGVMFFNFSLDPDHIFSKGGAYPFIAKGKRYYKIAGVINNYEIKNLVVGASLMNNTLPSEVEAAMGWEDTYLLTKDAADVARLYAFTSYALRKHDIGNVLFGLEPERMSRKSIESGAEDKSGPTESFMFLFDQSRLNDLRVFAQLPTQYFRSWRDSQKERTALEKSLGPRAGDKEILAASKDLNANYMTAHYRDFNRPLFIASLFNTAEKLVPVTEQHKKNVAENYELYLKPLVEGNPKTQFHFLLPPGAFFAKRAHRELNAYAARFMVERLLRYPNVKIHAFFNDEFNADLRLFRDYAHYHLEVTRFLLRSIAQNDHLLTAKNVDAYFAEYRRLLDGYKIPALWNAAYEGSQRMIYPVRGGENPNAGYITYRDAAKLVWGRQFSEKLYNSIPRSPFLAEERYVDAALRKTWPPLDTTRKVLESVKSIPKTAN